MMISDLVERNGSRRSPATINHRCGVGDREPMDWLWASEGRSRPLSIPQSIDLQRRLRREWQGHRPNARIPSSMGPRRRRMGWNWPRERDAAEDRVADGLEADWESPPFPNCARWLTRKSNPCRKS